ncbi:hypothetical protein T459_32659 [Capsicum annuum]|uniref:Uncharacterized protein n=1 Tax=Capsicum annuum TaxID=4072 RepID=A0A2G2Y195_CAPAN|nr:hypothetical protein T459_32659 [Capsicum annuum]
MREIKQKDGRLREMVYMHASIYECMRRFPPIPLYSNEAVEDNVWPDGTKMKKGTSIIYHIFAMGRSQELWGSDWADFRPEKWLERRSGTSNGGDWNFITKDPFTYPVFQVGPRTCLGKEIVVVLMKMVVATILKLFRVIPALDNFSPHYNSIVVSRMKSGFPASMGFLMPIGILVIRMTNRHEKCGRKLKIILYTHATLQIPVKSSPKSFDAGRIQLKTMGGLLTYNFITCCFVFNCFTLLRNFPFIRPVLQEGFYLAISSLVAWLLTYNFLTLFFRQAPDLQFYLPVLQEGFGMFVELEDDSAELVCSTVGKLGVEHVAVRSMLDIVLEEQSIMDFGSDYAELGHELGFEPESHDNGVFLSVPAVQLQ